MDSQPYFFRRYHFTILNNVNISAKFVYLLLIRRRTFILDLDYLSVYTDIATMFVSPLHSGGRGSYFYCFFWFWWPLMLVLTHWRCFCWSCRWQTTSKLTLRYNSKWLPSASVYWSVFFCNVFNVFSRRGAGWKKKDLSFTFYIFLLLETKQFQWPG